MRPLPIILVVAAIVVAVAVAFLANQLISDRASEAAREAREESTVQAPTVPVLVAARDVPAGRALVDADLRWEPWPRGGVPERFVQRSADAPLRGIVGAKARRGFTAGEPIVADRLFTPGESGFMSGALEPGMRAVSVPVTPASGAAGFILPGDQVDVLLTYQVRVPGGAGDRASLGPVVERAAETVVRDVRVLAVDQQTDDLNSDAKLVKTATLEVTPKQAEALSLAQAMGTIALSLRAYGDTRTAGTETDESLTTDLAMARALRAAVDSVSGAQAPRAAVAQSPRTKSPSGPSVRVFRGAEVTTNTFD